MLVLSAVVSGVLSVLLIRWTTPRHGMRDAVNRIYARLLECRLFFDEPALVWGAQVELVRDNLRLVRLVIPAALVLALPMLWLYRELDTRYGRRWLRPGEPAVVTARLQSGNGVELRAEGGVEVETPPIRVGREGKVVWRVRARGEGPFVVRAMQREQALPTVVGLPRDGRAVPWEVWWLVVCTGSAVGAARVWRVR
jgi:hypothetical protein